MTADNQNYYVTLAIFDRITADLSGYCQTDALRRLNAKCGTRFSDNGNASTGNTSVFKLLTVAETLNVSFEWLLTGRNKGVYKPVRLSRAKILKLANPQRLRDMGYDYKLPLPYALRLAYRKLKQTNWDLTVRQLVDFATFLNKNEYRLIAVELDNSGPLNRRDCRGALAPRNDEHREE